MAQHAQTQTADRNRSALDWLNFTRGTGRYNLAQGAAAASWGLGAALTAMREAIAQWGRRIRAHDKPNMLHDQRDIRRIRAEVEVERCKAFWRA